MCAGVRLFSMYLCVYVLMCVVREYYGSVRMYACARARVHVYGVECVNVSFVCLCLYLYISVNVSLYLLEKSPHGGIKE